MPAVYDSAPDYWQSPRGGQPMVIPYSAGRHQTMTVPFRDVEQIKRLARLLDDNEVSLEELKSLYTRLAQVIFSKPANHTQFRAEQIAQLRGLLEMTLATRLKDKSQNSFFRIFQNYGRLIRNFNALEKEDLSNFNQNSVTDFFIRSDRPPVPVYRKASINVDVRIFVSLTKFLFENPGMNDKDIQNLIVGAHKAVGRVKELDFRASDNERADAIDKQYKAVQRYLKTIPTCESHIANCWTDCRQM